MVVNVHGKTLKTMPGNGGNSGISFLGNSTIWREISAFELIKKYIKIEGKFLQKLKGTVQILEGNFE